MHPGINTKFHPGSNQKKSQVFMRDGKKDSVEIKWDINGNVVSQIKYKNGIDIDAPVVDTTDSIVTSKNIKNALKRKIYGQDLAIDLVADAFKNNVNTDNESPKHTFLFFGAPGTGKSYLAELLSEELEDYSITNYDMSQYSFPDSGGGLYGSGRMWGNTHPGSLTSFVRDNPKSIIIFDEFEKAHSSVQSNLLTIFGSGYLKDACGWCPTTGRPWGAPGLTVTDSLDQDNQENEEGDGKCNISTIEDIIDFKDTIIIIASNLGKELYTDKNFHSMISLDYLRAESMLLDVLAHENATNSKSGVAEPAILPELISRFSMANMVIFNNHTYSSLEKIAKASLLSYHNVISKQHKITIPLSNDLDYYVKSQILAFAPELASRRIKNKIGVLLFDKVTDKIVEIDETMVYCRKINIKVAKKAKDFLDDFSTDLIKSGKLINHMFRKNLTIETDSELKDKNGIFTYTIKDCRVTTVKKLADYGSEGLVFQIPNTSFSDIAGHSKAKMRLSETVNLLKNTDKLKEFKVSPPKGMLLYGPPGTGKTMLAKAFANEADLPFIATTGTDLLDPTKIKAIFEKARTYSPSIIFIDEIDGLGSRDKNNGREIPINKILAEIDGFTTGKDDGVFIIAATNYKDRVDSAITRAGRIELHIEVGHLDKEARLYFLKKMFKDSPVDPKADIDNILIFTAGLNGSQMQLITKEASIYCIRHGLDLITEDIIIEQINTIKYGAKKETKKILNQIESTAYHEAGHAVLSRMLMPDVKIEQITVLPREDALGFVSFAENEDATNNTVQDMKNKICVAMAGRVAQIKKYGPIEGVDTGASSDLMHATNTARLAISMFGMDEELGYTNIMTGSMNTLFKDDIDNAIKRWLREGQDSTFKHIDAYWDKITILAKILVKDGVVSGEELDEIL